MSTPGASSGIRFTNPPRASGRLYPAPNGTRWEKEKAAAGGNSFDYDSDPKSIGPWILGECIGKGASGRVKIARHSRTGLLAAVKILPLKPVLDSRHSLATQQAKSEKQRLGIDREITMMKLMDHPNIMRIYDVYEDEQELYLVLEYIEGGELFDFIVNRGRLDQFDALVCFQQIIYGLNYAHAFSIIHRDLKPENILIHSLTPPLIKIADWGMAAFAPPTLQLETSCGSPHYASPEIVNGHKYQGTATDIWSCGVILFALLCGRLPFDDKDIRTLLNKVKVGKYDIPNFLNPMAKDLLSRMLQVDVSARITIPEIIAHPWFNLLPSSGDYVAPPVHELAQPLPSPAHIERDIFESLLIIWGRHADAKLITDDLLSPPGEGTLAKAFYFLLTKYRDRTMSEDVCHTEVTRVVQLKRGSFGGSISTSMAPPVLQIGPATHERRSRVNQMRAPTKAEVLMPPVPGTHNARAPSPHGPRERPHIRPISMIHAPEPNGLARPVPVRQSSESGPAVVNDVRRPRSITSAVSPRSTGPRVRSLTHDAAGVGDARVPPAIQKYMLQASTRAPAPAPISPLSPRQLNDLRQSHHYHHQNRNGDENIANKMDSLTMCGNPENTAANLVAEHHRIMRENIQALRTRSQTVAGPDGRRELKHKHRVDDDDFVMVSPRITLRSDKEQRETMRDRRATMPSRSSDNHGLGIDNHTAGRHFGTDVGNINLPGVPMVEELFGLDKKTPKQRPLNPDTPNRSILSMSTTKSKRLVGQSQSSQVSSSTAVTSPVGEFKGWFSNLFAFKPAQFVLLSYQSLPVARDEISRLLETCFGAIVAVEDPDGNGIGVLHCRVDDTENGSSTLSQRQIRFRVEFSVGSICATTTTVTASMISRDGTVSDPSTPTTATRKSTSLFNDPAVGAVGPSVTQAASRQTYIGASPFSPPLVHASWLDTPRTSNIDGSQDERLAQSYSLGPCTVQITHEKGSVAAFRNISRRLREEWCLDDKKLLSTPDLTLVPVTFPTPSMGTESWEPKTLFVA